MKVIASTATKTSKPVASRSSMTAPLKCVRRNLLGNLFLALAQGFISGPGGDALCLHGECGPIVMQGYTRTGTYACVDTVPASQER